MTGSELEVVARNDPDAIPLNEEWFRAERLAVPRSEKEQIPIRPHQ